MKTMMATPFKEEDREILEKWRLGFTDATLELSHDYTSPQTETAVVRDRDGKIILSLTGTIVSGLGPLIKNPEANRLEIIEALFLAEAALNYKAIGAGAVDAFVIVPNRMKDYVKVLEKLGYTIVATECVVLGRVLQRDAPKLEPEVVSPTEVAESTPEAVESQDERADAAEMS